MEVNLLKTALALYTAATTLAFIYLFSKRERWSLWMLRLLGGGLALQLAAFVFRVRAFWMIPENRFFMPVSTFFGALSFMSLAVATIFFIVERKHRLGILGAFVLPWTVGTLGPALGLADPAVGGLVPVLRSYWMNIHPMVIMVSYAAFATAFGVGVAFLIQEKQIKSRRPSELCYRLPSLDELDSLNYRLIVMAFPVLTVGILMGGIWAYESWGRFWGWDPKETWSLITAMIYAGYLHMRLVKGMRGRKAIYVSMVGFAAVVFTFYGVNFLSRLHGYL